MFSASYNLISSSAAHSSNLGRDTCFIGATRVLEHINLTVISDSSFVLSLASQKQYSHFSPRTFLTILRVVVIYYRSFNAESYLLQLVAISCGTASSQPNLYFQSDCKMILAFTITGPRSPRGSNGVDI